MCLPGRPHPWEADSSEGGAETEAVRLQVLGEKGPVEEGQEIDEEELGKGKRLKKAVTRLNLLLGASSSSSPPVPPRGPQSWKEAMSLPDAEEWRKAARAEMEMLDVLRVWEDVDLLAGRKPISYRWVFTKKKQGEGYHVWHCDVKTAFLHGVIHMSIYLQQPKASRMGPAGCGVCTNPCMA